jgi:hypothetical protein
MSNKSTDVSAMLRGTNQKVTVAAASAAITNATGTQTRYVRLATTTDCYYTTGTAPTATTSDVLLPAGTVEVIALRPSQKIAFIRNTADGVATVTELSA